MPPPPLPNPVIVTTASKLSEIIDDAVARAVKREIGAVLDAQQTDPGWYDSRRAQTAYGRSRSTLYRWAKAGQIKTKRIGGTVYYKAP